MKLFHWKIRDVMDLFVMAPDTEAARAAILKDVEGWLSLDHPTLKLSVETLAGPPLFVADAGYVISINDPRCPEWKRSPNS